MNKLKLTNRPHEHAIVCEKGLAAIKKDKYLTSLGFINKLRAHQSGYPIFQRCVTTAEGVAFETIYLHRWLAGKFIKKPKSEQRLFVRFKNDNPKDCRIENLEYANMSQIRSNAGLKKSSKATSKKK